MLTNAPFVQARNYTPRSRLIITGVCIHTMEAPEGPNTAENIANWFKIQPGNGATVDPKTMQPLAVSQGGIHFAGTSAHWNVDSDSIVQSVREHDIAWHAGPANGWSIGVEHAGYARQSSVEWLDAYSLSMLERSAQLVAEICNRWEIPIVRLTGDDLKVGQHAGIFGHVDVTNGLSGGKGHTDPGPFFPWEFYLDMVGQKFETLKGI